MPQTELACPHYLPTSLGGPQVLCAGCGSLIADHRHPQNQALGISAPILLQRPEVRQAPRSTLRKG